jgi:hypothetical protein
MAFGGLIEEGYILSQSCQGGVWAQGNALLVAIQMIESLEPLLMHWKCLALCLEGLDPHLFSYRWRRARYRVR